MLETGLAWAAVIFFASASVILWQALRRDNQPLFGWGSASLAGGCVSAFVYMAVVSYRLGAFPIINPWIGASFLSFLLSAFALVAFARYQEKAFLAGSAPGSALFALLAAFQPVRPEQINRLAEKLQVLRPDVPGIGQEVMTSVWFPAHVTLALSAYALFALAATMGILQLALLRVLKNKRGGRPLQFLPSLPVVEQAGVFAVVMGLVFLFIAMTIGALGARSVLGLNFMGEPKEIAGAAVLVLYGIIEAIRKFNSWPGRRTAMAHVGAFIVLLAVFLGSSILRTSGF